MMPSNQKSQRPRRVELVQRFSPSCASQEASAAGTGSLFGAQLDFSNPTSLPSVFVPDICFTWIADLDIFFVT